MQDRAWFARNNFISCPKSSSINGHALPPPVPGEKLFACPVDMLNSAEIFDGVAEVDFKDLREVIPNASSSCGSALLLAQLDATAKQFEEVDRTLYSINGDASTFYEWLQMAVPDA